MAWIEFQGVQKHFGPKKVYKDLNLQIHRGESVTIIGGSGQGKSVMLKLLMGLLRVDAGSIFFDGEEITQKTEKDFLNVRKRVGMLFQGAALFDSLSVSENVAYGLHEHLHLSKTEVQTRVAESLNNVGLAGTENMWPSDLSGGMKKRVGLARAIAMRPEVLLYDEPTTGLDPINTTRINRLILRLKESLNITTVVVTHDMQSAFTISDRIVMIHHGRVIFSGTPDEVRAATLPEVRDFVTGAPPDKDELSDLLRS